MWVSLGGRARGGGGGGGGVLFPKTHPDTLLAKIMHPYPLVEGRISIRRVNNSFILLENHIL